MPKRRQHYVPKFYLRAFQSAPRRIHLYHLTSRNAIEHASLRDQCFIHKFYGPSEEIEDGLAALEGIAAPVVRAICESGEPPVLKTEQHAILLAFVGLQILRTPVERQKIKDFGAKMDDQVFGDRDPLPESGLSRFSPIHDYEALELQLKFLPQYIDALSDLQLHVARTGLREKLITSDNPVFKYNSYCRGVRYRGVIGNYCRGLQIFLPLSPRVLLLLYDGAVYDVEEGGAASASSRGIRRADVERLNAVQIMNAESCVYFSEWSHIETVDRLAAVHLPYKQSEIVRVNEGPVVGSENTSIVHLWETHLELKFSLPLSRLRWQAKKVPPKERASAYRRECSTWGAE